MFKTILLTESLNLVHKGGIVSCNDAGHLKNATHSKSRPDVSQYNTERQSTISEGGCFDKESRESSQEVGSSVTNSTIDSRDNLSYSPRLGVATETRTGLLQSPTSSKFFQNTHFKIQRSTIAGLGAIAARNLKEGDVILRERPLFTANASGVFKAYEMLTGHDKNVAMSLHANALLKPGMPRIQAIWRTNCFAVTETVAGLFPVASRFNHACHPSQNIDYTFDQHSGLLLLSVRAKHIAAGEELKISYGTDRTPQDLYRLYGFICQCGTCSGMIEDHSTIVGSRW